MKPLYYLALCIAVAVLFVAVPALDIETARFLSDPRAPFPFPWRDWAPVAFLHDWVPAISTVVTVGVIVAALLRLTPGLARYSPRGAAIAYIALSLAIGPGLITNVLLKENSGRARPAQVTEFGGPKAFSPVLIPAQQCERNCSFVSGHAATGFFLTSFAFLVAPGARRRLAIAGAVAAGGAFGLARMAEGGHWLSDVVFAGLINFAVAWVLYRLLIAREDFAQGFAVLARRPAVKRHALVFLGVAAAAGTAIAFVDRPVATLVGQAPPEVHAWFNSIAAIGDSTLWYIVMVLGAAAFWLAGRHAAGTAWGERLKAWAMLPLFAFSAVSLAGLIGLALKILFGRARPPVFLRLGDADFHWFSLSAKYMSFPSGHANTITALMVVLGFIWPRWRWAFLGVALVAVIARVVEYQHYVSDVLVGAWIGAVAAIWVKGVFARSGIEPVAAREGRFAPRANVPWRERLGL